MRAEEEDTPEKTHVVDVQEMEKEKQTEDEVGSDFNLISDRDVMLFTDLISPSPTKSRRGQVLSLLGVESLRLLCVFSVS